MSSKQKSYDRTAKLHAVKRVIEDGHCPHHVAADLEIMAEQVHTWIRRYATPVEKSPNRLRLKTPTDELVDLRRQVESLKKEQEFYRTLIERSQRVRP